MLDLQGMCQVVGFLNDDTIGQFIIERFVVLEPLDVGQFIELARELGILASCLYTGKID